MPGRIKVRVADLRRGDMLVATGREVVATSAGIDTPAGYIEVLLRGADGREQRDSDGELHSHGLWRRDTRILVERN